MITAKIDTAPAAARLARIAKETRTSVRSACEAAVQALLAIVQRKLSGEVLQPRSGALRRSIRTDVAEEARGVEARVFSDGGVPYARIQEYGGRIALPAIVAVNAKALAFAWEGRLVFAKRASAHVVTLPERSYLRASLAEFAPALADSFRKVAGELSA
jgi:phage gpG-like protein